MTSAHTRNFIEKALDQILSFEGETRAGKPPDPSPKACSNCFRDVGLHLDAHHLGSDPQASCPNCGKHGGMKLSADQLFALAQRFFVWGSLANAKYGAAPRIQFNSHQPTSIAAPHWLSKDIEVFERVLGVGFFHYGPRLWMVGEVEPLKQLLEATTRRTVIDRILAEYPTMSVSASQRFYRVRNAPALPDSPGEYDSPPPQFLGRGRLDEMTRPVLYGSPDLQTCLHECRVGAEDELFVATLAPLQELKLINLSSVLVEDKGITEFESLDMAVHMLFLAGKHSYLITREIARAVHGAGFDGLVYPSYFSLLRTGSMPFETSFGLSGRRIPEFHGYEQDKIVPNLALFGRPIAEGKVSVECINRVVLAKVHYEAHFGPVGFE